MKTKCAICQTELELPDDVVIPVDEFGNLTEGFLLCPKCVKEAAPNLTMESGDVMYQDEDEENDPGEFGMGGDWWKMGGGYDN